MHHRKAAAVEKGFPLVVCNSGLSMVYTEMAAAVDTPRSTAIVETIPAA